MTRSNKKSKVLLKDAIISIFGNYDVSRLDNDFINSIEFENNSINQCLNNFKNLINLNLVNSKITSITNCGNLINLKIKNNNYIDILENLNNLKVLELTDLTELESIELVKIKQLCLNNLPKLNKIITGHSLKHLLITNCPLIDTIPSVYSLTHLYLDNLMIDTIYGLNNPLEYLEINNCENLKNIYELTFIKTIKVNNCMNLNSITNISECTSVLINDCTNLNEIYKLSQINNLTIKCCNNLRTITILTTNLLNLSNCNKLKQISYSSYKSIRLEYCLVYEQCNITNETENIYINDCPNIRLNNSIISRIQYTPINLTLCNMSNITILKDLSFNELNLDNTNIKQIHNCVFANLIITSCHLLEIIRNIKINNKLEIRECDKLTAIGNMGCVKKIKLLYLRNLKILDFTDHKILNTLIIEHCPVLNITYKDDNNLINVNIVNSGIMVLNGLSSIKTFIIKDCKLFKNISSNRFSIKDAIINYTTQKINFDFNKNLLVKFFIHIKFIKSIKKLKILKSITSCAICLDNFNNKDNIYLTKCMHKFHKTCLNEWVRNNNKCPLCMTHNP